MWIKLAERLIAKKRTKIRLQFNVPNNVPVYEEDVPEPKIVGSRGGWFTRGGKPIHFPSAYSKKGRSNMVYQCSTRTIIVPIGTLK